MNKLKTISCALAVVLTFALVATFLTTTPTAEAYKMTENGQKNYSIAADRVMYETEDMILKSIETFEAWIRLPENLADNIDLGVIFGNYYNRSCGLPDAVNYSVTSGGYFKISWGCYKSGYYDKFKFQHVFNKADLRTGEWTHVALVRNLQRGTVTYYVNGVFNDVAMAPEGESIARMRFGIGSDWNNWFDDKTPFMGEIRQITLYETAQNVATIAEDMQKTEIFSSERQGLIANWNFTETWGSTERVLDTSDNGYDCRRATYDKYVEVKEQNDFDYSFVVVPDMQAMTNAGTPGAENKRRHQNNFKTQQQWVIDNTEKLNIKFAMYLGDFAEHYSEEGTSSLFNRAYAVEEWALIKHTMSMLDGVVPYTVVPGNHDYDDGATRSRSLKFFNDCFPYDKFSSFYYFGGAFEKGHTENMYFDLYVGEVRYLLFQLEYNPRYTVMNWVDRIISEHPDSRVIISSHTIVEVNGDFASSAPLVHGSNAGAQNGIDMWNSTMRKHANMFMSFSGHLVTDNVVMRRDTGDNGNVVTSILVNAQGAMMTSGMNTLLIVKVNERTKTMHLCYYSPEYDMCYNEQSQFSISFADQNNPTVGLAEVD